MASTQIELRTNPEDEFIESRVELKNVTGRLLRIDKVSVSCSCIGVDLEQDTVQIGQSTFLNIKFQNNKVGKTKATQVNVYANGKRVGEIRVTILSRQLIRIDPSVSLDGRVKEQIAVSVKSDIYSMDELSELEFQISGRGVKDQRVRLRKGIVAFEFDPTLLDALILSEFPVQLSAIKGKEVVFQDTLVLKLQSVCRNTPSVPTIRIAQGRARTRFVLSCATTDQKSILGAADFDDQSIVIDQKIKKLGSNAWMLEVEWDGHAIPEVILISINDKPSLRISEFNLESETDLEPVVESQKEQEQYP